MVLDSARGIEVVMDSARDGGNRLSKVVVVMDSARRWW